MLLNDTTYVESARKFAERLIKEAGPTPAQRITHAFRLALSRAPTADEQRIVLALYQGAIERFRGDKTAAEKLVAVGDAPREPGIDVVELAGWTTIASVVLNLDETISKE